MPGFRSLDCSIVLPSPVTTGDADGGGTNLMLGRVIVGPEGRSWVTRGSARLRVAPVVWLTAALTACTVLAGCSSTPAAESTSRTTQAPQRSTSDGAAPARPAPPSTTTTTVPPTTTTTEQPGWAPISSAFGVILADEHSVTQPDGDVVTLVRFRSGRTRFSLHVGSSDPPTGSAAIGPDSGPAIGPGEVPLLVGAFNGGFKAAAGAGGFELGGQILLPLQPGLASLVIDVNGVAHVGIWGQTLPTPGEQVASVRQNLGPLVAGGQPSLSVTDISAWGSTLGGGAAVARSSLGEDLAGNLVYAASMSAVPADLADALSGAGVVSAMELDINPEWVAVMTAASPGAPTVATLPGQNRPANQYQVGWTRDFVTVLAAA